MDRYIRIRKPIIHGEWEAATSSLLAMLGHEKVAPSANDVPRWTSDDPGEPGEIQLYQTSNILLPLLEGELDALRQTDLVLQAGYDAMKYFTDGDKFTGSQTTKPARFRKTNKNSGQLPSNNLVNVRPIIFGNQGTFISVCKTENCSISDQ